MSRQERDTTGDADRRFAKNLFTGGSVADANAADDEHQGASEYTEEQRRWARELFASDPADAVVFAGLTNGRTVGRWQRPAIDD